MPPRRHESACLAAQAAHHHHRGQCQPRSAPASLSFSRHDLSLSFSLSLVRRRPHFEHLRARSLPSATLPRALVASAVMLVAPALSVGFEEMLSQVDFALWKGVRFGQIWEKNFRGNFVEISPNVGGLQEGFFLWITEPARSARSAPTSISPPLPPPPPPPSEVALGERSRPPVRVRVDPTPSPSPRPTAFSSCLRVAWERLAGGWGLGLGALG